MTSTLGAPAAALGLIEGMEQARFYAAVNATASVLAGLGAAYCGLPWPRHSPHKRRGSLASLLGGVSQRV
ncbi:MAG TPA: hypothetical protein VE645_10335 [Pseudonocardiaceae bacterium]|nr:hypothetical protein [Pseudonocardiaceae bacterium]